MPSSKPDCACALQRKAGTVKLFTAEWSVLSVRLVEEESRNTGMFRVFLGKWRRTSSAVKTAWRRERDSNPLQFCRAKPRYIRKLQIAKPYQRISSKTRHQIFAISPVSIHRPFGHERRTPGDSVAKSGHCVRTHGARLGSHVTACIACSHKTESFSGGRNYLRRGFLIVFDFYARAVSAVVAPLPTSRLLDSMALRAFPGATSGHPS
jgi:hypothetical protein